MANFKTHLAGGIVSGAGFSVAGVATSSLSLTQAGAVFTVGAFASLIPDLDSDTGKPLAFLFQLISVLVPCLFYQQAVKFGGHSAEFLICYFVSSYFFMNYVVCGLIKKITVHRGIMHSLPFALLCGSIGYWLFIKSGPQMAYMVGLAALGGCLVHLVLDELNAFKLKHGIVPGLKKSSGSAFKMKSQSTLTTLFIYTLLVMVVIANWLS